MERDDSAMVECLLKYGANANQIYGWEEDTLLMHAARGVGSIEITEILSRYGADPNVKGWKVSISV